MSAPYGEYPVSQQMEEALRVARGERGLTIKQLAESIIEVLDKEELRVLIEQLQTYASIDSKK